MKLVQTLSAPLIKYTPPLVPFKAVDVNLITYHTPLNTNMNF